MPRNLHGHTFRHATVHHVSDGGAAEVVPEHLEEALLRVGFEGYPARFRAEAIAPLQNKAGAFLTDPLLHRILTQPESTFDLREVMDEGKILLVNLAKGKIGGDTAALLGALLVARIGLAAVSRADLSEGSGGIFSCISMNSRTSRR